MIPTGFRVLGTCKLGDGDCLPDGTFSTEAPNGIVTGGGCLINGDNLFRSRADVVEVTGNFSNMTRCQGIFFATGVKRLTAVFPVCSNFYTAFFNCKLEGSVLLNAPNAENLYGTFQGNTSLINLTVNSTKITSIRSLITSCTKIKTIDFTGGLADVTNAIDFANGCSQLASESIDHIIDTLPMVSTRDIGFVNVPMSQSQYDSFVEKGWSPVGAVIT